VFTSTNSRHVREVTNCSRHGGAALNIDFSLGRLTRDVLGIGTLMFGITAAARLPRIADGAKWTIAGWGTLAACMLIFAVTATPDAQGAMGTSLAQRAGLDATGCVGAGTGIAIGCASGAGFGTPTLAIWITALLVAAISNIFTAISPRRGHYMLPALGLVAASFIVLAILRADMTPAAAGAKGPSLWPLVLGGALFFYLWWLSAMVFDLSYIWRQYTRKAAIRTHLARYASVMQQSGASQ